MAVITFPTLTRQGPSSMRWGNLTPSREARGAGGAWPTGEIPYAGRWTVDLVFEVITDLDRGMVEAWLMQMRGKVNRTDLYDWSCVAPRGTMRGSPTVSAIAQGAVTTTVTGSGTWKRGDKFNLGTGGQLIMAVNDGTAGGSMTFEPPARTAVGGGTALIWDKPTARFMLTADEWGADVQPPALASIRVSLVENWT